MCLCKDVEFGSYDHTVSMLIPFDQYDILGEKKDSNWVCIDVCIATEIAWLWHQGVNTTNSCCGHNKIKPWVIVDPEFIPKMHELGYELADEGSARPEATFTLKLSALEN